MKKNDTFEKKTEELYGFARGPVDHRVQLSEKVPEDAQSGSSAPRPSSLRLGTQLDQLGRKGWGTEVGIFVVFLIERVVVVVLFFFSIGFLSGCFWCCFTSEARPTTVASAAEAGGKFYGTQVRILVTSCGHNVGALIYRHFFAPVPGHLPC